MKKRLLITSAIAGGFLLICGIFVIIGYMNYMTIEAKEYDAELEILYGGGGNSIILTSEDGKQAVVIDTKTGKAAKEMRKKIHARDLTVICTHYHPDHTGGNALYPDAKLIAGAYSKEEWANGRYPDETVKPGEEKVLTIGSETVHVRNMGRAHTSNDCVVFLEKRRKLITGDLLFLAMHPVLKTESGCNVGSWVRVLDTLLVRYDPKAVLPGHGTLSDKAAITAMKEYFVSIGESIGKKQKQAELKKKYKDYYSLPAMSSFEKTVNFIEEERTGK